MMADSRLIEYNWIQGVERLGRYTEVITLLGMVGDILHDISLQANLGPRAI